MLKTRLWNRCFPVKFAFYKNTSFIQDLRTTASNTKQTSTVATTEFLGKIPDRKKISYEHFNLCETEISLDEIIKSKNFETNYKPLGNGNLTAEFHKHFSNELAPVLLNVYNSWGKLGATGVTSRTGITLVKYKKGHKKTLQTTGIYCNYYHILQFLRINCKNNLHTIIGEHQSEAIENRITLL